ncbi:MAG: biopolymer transporter ExbD [Myxococcota bacterium]|nr:biopolymer transporter ExbD [Myxococcota bacterium]
MAAKLGGDDDAIISDINVTPLVDITLVVLIIFMVTAVDIAKSAIKVKLPEAATGEASENISLGLQLTADGTLTVDGNEVTEAQLRQVIQDAKTEAGDADVVCLIAADAEVPHKRFIWLLDLVRQEGVAQYAINIDPVSVEAGEAMKPLPEEG